MALPNLARSAASLPACTRQSRSKYVACDRKEGVGLQDSAIRPTAYISIMVQSIAVSRNLLVASHNRAQSSLELLNDRIWQFREPCIVREILVSLRWCDFVVLGIERFAQLN